jgi:hypothetical protein
VYFDRCTLTIQFCTDIKHTLLDRKREDRSGRTVAGRSPRNFFMRAVFGLLLSFSSVLNFATFSEEKTHIKSRHSRTKHSLAEVPYRKTRKACFAMKPTTSVSPNQLFSPLSCRPTAPGA